VTSPTIFIYLFIKLRPSITYKEKQIEEEAKKKTKQNKTKQKKRQTAQQNKMTRGAATAYRPSRRLSKTKGQGFQIPPVFSTFSKTSVFVTD